MVETSNLPVYKIKVRVALRTLGIFLSIGSKTVHTAALLYACGALRHVKMAVKKEKI
jgi:hypothetical protein